MFPHKVYFPTFGIFSCEGRRRWASAVRAHPHLVEETSSLLSQLHRGKKNVLGKKGRLPKKVWLSVMGGGAIGTSMKFEASSVSLLVILGFPAFRQVVF